MKVCFLAGTLGRGGAERQLVYMLRVLQSAKIEVRVLCLTKGEAFEDEIHNLGVEIDWVGKSQNRLARVAEIVKNLKSQPADILQSAHFYTNIYAGITGKALGVKSIGAIRSDLNSEVASHGLLGKWQLKSPHHLIANTQLAVDRAIERGICPSKINFVRNAIDVLETNFPPIPPKNELNVILVGRLSIEKRPGLFVKLAYLLKREYFQNSLKFQIIGDGPLRQSLEQLAAKYELSESDLSFLGVQSDMSKIYQNADILILTSSHEGTPNVLLEAMAYKVPIVATKVGGVPDILNDSRGFVIEPFDEKGLLTAIVKLIDNAELRAQLAEEGYRYVLQNHSLDYLRNKLISIYQKLL